MNKAILMSIQPKWLAKILNGEKTIDIRKNKPNCELPIDVYLYCTKGKPMARYEAVVQLNGGSIGSDYIYETTTKNDKSAKCFVNGKVVAKFTLRWRDKRSIAGLTHSLSDFNTFLKRAGIDWYKNSKEFHDYVSEKDYIYAWYIDNLVIFDKPMDLGDFYKIDVKKELPNDFYLRYVFSIKQAPQSWQYAYVEDKV